MVDLGSLLVNDGVCTVPVCPGRLVFWYADGSCRRISCSYPSLDSIVRECREWWLARDFCQSVSFWSGGVCVCRVSAASLWAPVLGVC